MRLLVVGCSYRTAPLALRERVGFSAADVPTALAEMRALPELREIMLLSTCNRVEVYASATKPSHAGTHLREYLSRSRGVSSEELEGALYQLKDAEAVKHIFNVTSSLEAMVVGEAQIAGQVKEAYAAASRARTVGPLISRCMHRAFAAAKRVRTETDIARHPVSVSSVAADLAARVFGDLGSATVLVVGAGEMAELAVRHLISDGAADIRVANRTYERAVELAFQLGAKAVQFEGLRGQLLLADVVVTSTGSETPILGRTLVAEVMRQRKHRPLLLVDIAVPRDVEKEVGSLPDVYLFDVDDLEQVVAENLKERHKEVRQAERIVDEEVAHFEDWLRKQDAVPVIKLLREQFTEVVRSEAAHTAQSLRLERPEQRELFEAMTSAIVNKLLHRPTVELKRQAEMASGSTLATTVRELFDLPDGTGEGGSPQSPPREELGDEDEAPLEEEN
jgi:glutamyl-tRNA reductase